MSKEQYHIQCTMRKKVAEKSYTHITSWIPEKYAVKGKWLKLKERGDWIDGWEVRAVYDKEKTSTIITRERDFMNQRTVSDI